MADLVTVIVGLLLIFFLPGFALIRLIFPRKEELNPEYGLLYQIALGMVLSLVVVVLFGFALTSFGPNPSTGKGYFEAGNLWIGLSLLTLVFFIGGWFRGAYPSMGRIHPALARYPRPIDDSLPRDRRIAAEYRRLAAERQRVLKELRSHESSARISSGDLREHHLKQKAKRQAGLAEIDERLEKLREGVVDEKTPAGQSGENASGS